MREIIVPSRMVYGRVKMRRVADVADPAPRTRLAHGQRPWWWPGEKPGESWDHNDWLFEWGSLLGPLLQEGDQRYRISAMYLEYENVGDPDDVVTPPVVTRDAGRNYYDELISDPVRDYLRVPIIASTRSLLGDTIYDSAGISLRWFAQSSGVVGAHGKEFSDAVNSKVIGGALVAMVDEGDATQDLILSRFYASTSRQMVKLSNGQIGAEWEAILK